jgi:hypothetical protein
MEKALAASVKSDVATTKLVAIFSAAKPASSHTKNTE